MSTYTGFPSVFSSNPFVVDEANPSHQLGEVMVTPDGRKFRYALAGSTALVAGQLLQSAAEDTGDQNITPTATSIGATSVTTSTTMTVTANQYAGGWMVVTVTPGVGISYRIKSHAAYTAAAATFTLEDPIQVALTTNSRVDFVANPYNGVIQNPTTATGTIVGVAVNNITASQYGWIQTGGVCALLAQGTITVGNLVVASNGVAGAVENAVNASTEAQAPVGVAVTGIADTEYGSVKLLID